jgi:predicted MPP superfamily phosphohydrolase
MVFAGGTALTGSSVYALQSANLEISRQRVMVAGINKPLRIVALSDLHDPCPYVYVPDLIKTINSENPDLFIMAGDIFSTRESEKLISKLGEINADCMKLAVPGNWEYRVYPGLENLRRRFGDVGIKLLVNEVCEIQGITVIGLDDLLEGSPDFNTLRSVSSGPAPNIVISHCPGSFDYFKSDSHSHKQTICISGHTHGGQIAPFGRVLVTPRGSGTYVQGWYHHQNNSMYVMRGVGTSVLPLRIGARPELLVLDLIPIKRGGNG